MRNEENEILEAIDSRLDFFLNYNSIVDLAEKSLVQKIEVPLNSNILTSIDLYLILTGQYPNYSEIKQLNFELQVNKLDTTIEHFLGLILSSPLRTKICLNTTLVLADNYDLIDVTHTHSYPHITGIQRVTRKTVDYTTNASLVVFDTNYRSFTEISKPIFSAHHAKTMHENLAQNHEVIYDQRLIKFLYRCLPKLEKNNFGLLIKKLSLPIARVLKKWLIDPVEATNQSQRDQSDDRLTNVYIAGSRLTIIDIPQNDGTLDVYQALFEFKFLRTQLVLYDFIPIFHTWLVHGLAGHFTKYLRIVMFADRIIGISSLVAEQARLIVAAFKLERIDWASNSQIIDFSDLPSGLDPDYQQESLSRIPGRILIIGSIEPRKNHLQIFHALEILHQRGCHFEAIIVGNTGWENEPILRKFYELRNSGVRIERRVHTDDAELMSLLKTSSLGIFLSEAEGFGLPIIESRQFGLPILYSRVRPHIDISLNFPEDAIEIGDVLGLSQKIEERLSIDLSGSNSPLGNSSQWSKWTNFLFLDGSPDSN